MDRAEFSRRNFLWHSLAGAGGAWLAAAWPEILAAQQHAHHAMREVAAGAPAKFEFLSHAQAAEVEAISALIIPATDTPGAREAGVLVTLDAKNNFPQLPVRTDGPFLIWLGVLKDNEMLQASFTPEEERALQPLLATGLLREAPELVVLDPTPRSRLRWLPSVGLP